MKIVTTGMMCRAVHRSPDGLITAEFERTTHSVVVGGDPEHEGLYTVSITKTPEEMWDINPVVGKTYTFEQKIEVTP